MVEYTYIETRDELVEFAERHGLRHDWHEPDEQGVSARFVGTILDNAFGARGHDRPSPRARYEDAPPASEYSDLWEGHELRVVLEAEGYEDDGTYTKERAVINLASLLAWAADDRYADMIAPIKEKVA